jgi:hypothetical protein
MVMRITFFYIFLNYVIREENAGVFYQETKMFESFLKWTGRLNRAVVWCALILLTVMAFTGSVEGASLYQYVDEDGNVIFTDDPSDPRYKYKPVRTYESEQSESKSAEPEAAEKVKPETTKAATKGGLTPEEATERERIVSKIAQLEKIKSETENEKYKVMLQSELDMLNDQLKELNKKMK